MNNVYFTKSFSESSIRDVAGRVLSDIAMSICGSDKVAVKLHFGEEGNTRYVKPAQVKPVTEEIRRYSEDYFLTDANALYVGRRHNGTDHLLIAKEHGFTGIGVPVVIADGEDGKDEMMIGINGKIFNRVRIASAIAKADAVIAVSHFKGHVMFGFGGAIKNIGMGSGSRAGKLEMHSKIKPSVGKRCNGCGVCIEHCRAKAISLVGDKALIDHNICEGCAMCIAVCKRDAVEVPWGGASSAEVQKRCAEYALGAVMGKKIACVNFINNITKDCDCMSDTAIISDDIGIAASIDPVACDKAAYDLIAEKNGGNDIFKRATRTDGTGIFSYSKEIGLGNPDYKLILLS